MTNNITTMGMGVCCYSKQKIYEKLSVRRKLRTGYGLLECKDEDKLNLTKESTKEIVKTVVLLKTVAILLCAVVTNNGWMATTNGGRGDLSGVIQSKCHFKFLERKR